MIDDNLAHPNEGIQARAVQTLHAFARQYYILHPTTSATTTPQGVQSSKSENNSNQSVSDSVDEKTLDAMRQSIVQK